MSPYGGFGTFPRTKNTLLLNFIKDDLMQQIKNTKNYCKNLWYTKFIKWPKQASNYYCFVCGAGCDLSSWAELETQWWSNQSQKESIDEHFIGEKAAQYIGKSQREREKNNSSYDDSNNVVSPSTARFMSVRLTDSLSKMTVRLMSVHLMTVCLLFPYTKPQAKRLLFERSLDESTWYPY